MLKKSLVVGTSLIFILGGCGDDPAGPKAPTHDHAVEAKTAEGSHNHEGSHAHAETMLKGATENMQLVKFLSPADKAVVGTTFKVVMGIEGMEVKPAGAIEATSGHHHIIIDGAPIEAGKPVPADAQHIHYGKGQTETELTLTPGVHTLTLQFANGAHLSYGPAMSSTITVTVQ
jgi:hypothetical protein